MGPLDIAIHLANFASPSLCLALLLPLLARFAYAKQGLALGYIEQVAILFIVGLIVLAAGVWVLGRDGMMLTYGALVLALASGQWFMVRR